MATYTLTFGSDVDVTVDGKTVTSPYTLTKSCTINVSTMVNPNSNYYISMNGTEVLSETVSFADEDLTIHANTASTGRTLALNAVVNFTISAAPKVNIGLTTLSGYESLAAGTYNIGVKAKAANYQDSDLSATVSFTKLAAPVATAADTTVSRDAVTNAESYDVYVDGELYENTTGWGASAYQVTVNITGTSGYVDPNGVKIYQSDEIPDGDPQVTGTLVPGAEQLGVVKMGESSIFTITKKYIILDDTGGSWYGNLDPTIGTGITHVYGLGCCYFAVTANGTITADFFCLTGDTLITLADGSSKRIDQLTLNDKVLSYNPETLLLEPDEITYTDATENKSFTEYDRWTFEDGSVVKTVHRHRFYNVERQAMVYMDEWKIGEHAITIDDKKIALVGHETITEETRHYTIFTKNQNYFANGLLSGNRYTKSLTL